MTLPFFSYGFSALLLLAAGQDLWKLKISNIFPIALIALYLARAMFVGLQSDMWQNVAVFALALSVGIFLFAKRWLGGGDVKLFAATALWFDFVAAPYLLFAITFGGAIIALAFIFIRRLLPAGLEEKTGWVSLKRKGPIPYGLAIAVGAILCSQVYAFNPAPHKGAKDFMVSTPLKVT
jgi:prepilin peptidase CpaA